MKKDVLYSFGISRSTFSSNFPSILAILLMSIITITPILSINKYLMVLWLFFFLFEFPKVTNSNRKVKNIFILGVLFVLVCILYKILGISSANIVYCFIAPYLYFAPVLALMIIDRCNNEQQIRFLFHFLAFAIAINIADNIRLSFEYGIENLAFQSLRGAMEEEGLVGLNFGGSMFVNMSVFYACTMFMAFLKSNERYEKLLFLTYVGISSYFILVCSLKASAMILMIISFVLMYISVRSKKRIGTLMVFNVVVGGLLFLFRDTIINFLIDILDSDRISSRLLIFTTEGDIEDNGSFVARENLWLVSVDSWLGTFSSFIFGIGDHHWAEFISTADSGVGNHSDLLDVLARYGIIGAFLLYSSIKACYNYQKSKYGSSFKFEIISFFILILLMGLTKKFVYAQPAIIIFILFPLTLRYCSNIRKK